MPGGNPTLANLSFLGASHGTEAKHNNPLEQFLSSANEEKLALGADDEVDEAIALYPNKSYSQVRLVTDGEVLLVELQLFQPQYGKLGQKLAQT